MHELKPSLRCVLLLSPPPPLQAPNSPHNAQNLPEFDTLEESDRNVGYFGNFRGIDGHRVELEGPASKREGNRVM